MDPYSGPYIPHHSSFHVLFHSFIPSKPKKSQVASLSGFVRRGETGLLLTP